MILTKGAVPKWPKGTDCKSVIRRFKSDRHLQSALPSPMSVAPHPNPSPPEGRGATKAFTALGVVAPPPIHVAGPAFEGTLGTLFALVRDHRVDLLGVPLGPVCEAYLAFLVSDAERDLNEAATALAALAYLLERKAWRLLPVPEAEPEMDEPMEPIEPTIGGFAEAIAILRAGQSERELLFFRGAGPGPDPYELPYTLADVAPNDLARALDRLLRRAEPDVFESESRPRRSLTEQIELVAATLSEAWTPLERLLVSPFTREDAVYWFLGLLELVRVGKARARLGADDVEFVRA